MELHENRDNNSIPPFASKRLVGDYRPLFEYWRLARNRGREDLVEKAMLTDKDYSLLESIVSENVRISALDLVDIITEKLADRIDPSIAVEALEKLGYKMDKERAKLFIARLLAAWLVEAGDYWRIVKLS